MREPARWRRRMVATVTAVALAVGVALVASTTGPAPGPPEAARSNDPAAACRDLRSGAMVACLHGNDAPAGGQPVPPPDPAGAGGPQQPAQPQPPAARPGRAGAGDHRPGGGRAGVGGVHRQRHLREPDPGHLCPSRRRDRSLQHPPAVAAPVGGRGGPGGLAQRRPDRRGQAPALRHRRRLPARRRPGPADPAGRGRLRADADRAAGARLQPRRPQVPGLVRRRRGHLRPRRGLRRHPAGPGEPQQRRADVRPGRRPLLPVRRAARDLPQPGRGPAGRPNPSAAWHCTDEADVMCYDDDGAGPVVMANVCPPEHEALLDCGDDDYFSTDPPAGNYLASHWNTADSSFLQDDDAPRPAQLSLTGAATITYGGQADLRGRLTDEQAATGIEGEQVNLLANPAGPAEESGAGSATSGADGVVRFTPAPAATTSYRASFPGSGEYGTADSARVTVSVRPRVSARPQDSTVAYGQTVTVTGAVSPNHHGQRVYLQRLVGGRWKGAASAVLTGASGYTLRAKARARGRLTYRVAKPADADHASGTSRSFTVT